MILSLYFNHFRDNCIFSCIVLKICKLPICFDIVHNSSIPSSVFTSSENIAKVAAVAVTTTKI